MTSGQLIKLFPPSFMDNKDKSCLRELQELDEIIHIKCLAQGQHALISKDQALRTVYQVFVEKEKASL